MTLSQGKLLRISYPFIGNFKDKIIAFVYLIVFCRVNISILYMPPILHNKENVSFNNENGILLLYVAVGGMIVI